MTTEVSATAPLRLLLTPEEAAHALGISRATLYPMLMRRQIPSIRIGGSRRIPLIALQHYIDEQIGIMTIKRPSPSQVHLVRQHTRKQEKEA